MTIHLTGQDIAYVSEVAIKAGIRAAEMREGVSIRDKSDPEDKVTAADIELSQMLVSALSDRFPRDVVISEEDEKHPKSGIDDRVWLIDPIDGTDNYISNDGQYAVMIGLIVRRTPVFGWVYSPAKHTLYYGGPGFGAWSNKQKEEPMRFKPLPALDSEATARVMMGFRDRTSHPWVKEHPKVQLVKAGSIGLKMVKVLENEGDVFVHLSGKLKTWDTAGPAAIALGAGLDVGSMEIDELPFDTSKVLQECSVIMGRPGSLAWCRRYLRQPDKV
ncbi:MAG TPA: inositol monophosphatase family protein [Planktothrix sp.]